MQGLRTLTGQEVTPNDLLEVIYIPNLNPPAEPPAITGTIQKWKKKAVTPPFAKGLDSACLVAELRGERQ